MFRKFALLLTTLLAVSSWTLLAASQAEARRYASIVIDADSGQVLNAVNADSRNYPASLTKMMTLYLVFDALDKGKLTLDQKLRVSRRASGMPPSRLGVKRGDTIRVEDAILALTTKSANDIAVVLAEAVAGKETTFARMMTQQARELGMTKTTFRNASGLPNRGQKSTARDMARLGRALMNDFPQYYHYFSARSFSYNGRTYRNHNHLLKSYNGTDGIKTGYTRASGFNLVSSVERDGRRIIAVVFGGKTARSRDRQMMKLLNRGFKQIASMGVQTIPDVPGRNPFQTPVMTAEVEVADATPSPTPLPEPRPRLQPVAAAAQLATADDGDLTVDPDVVSNDWTVQVGAFSRFMAAHSTAKTALKAAPEVLEGAKVAIERIDSASVGTLYRSQLTGLYERQARNACQALIAADMNCVVIQPIAQGSD